MDATESAFRTTLAAHPHDWPLRLVYADWLEAEGRDVEARGQRWQGDNRKAPRPEYRSDCQLHPLILCLQLQPCTYWWKLDPHDPVGEDVEDIPEKLFLSLRGDFWDSYIWREYPTQAAAELALAEALERLREKEQQGERTHCPICGIEFEEVHEVNVCSNCNEISQRDALLGPDEDYAWVL